MQAFAQEWTWYPRAADQGPQDVDRSWDGHGMVGSSHLVTGEAACF